MDRKEAEVGVEPWELFRALAGYGCLEVPCSTPPNTLTLPLSNDDELDAKLSLKLCII